MPSIFFLRANVLGVHIIKNRAKRRHIVVRHAAFAVDAVIHGDVTHPVQREKLLDIVAGLYVIAPEPRQILGYNRVDFARADKLQHFAKSRAVEAYAGIAVVGYYAHDKKAVLRRIAGQKITLVCYAF